MFRNRTQPSKGSNGKTDRTTADPTIEEILDRLHKLTGSEQTEQQVRDAMGIGSDPRVNIRVVTLPPWSPELRDFRPDDPLPDVDAVDRFAEAGITAAAEARIQLVLEDVFDEVVRAVGKHRPMNSPHEGYAVMKEEFEELWDEIKRDGGGRGGKARQEAVQVAAMAVRYILDIQPGVPETQ